MKNSDNSRDAHLVVLKEIETKVSPLLAQLKGVSAGSLDAAHALSALENNLQQLADSYESGAHLDDAYRQLTASEQRVAALVRQGMPTKTIASTLNISSATIETHRKRIRKKLAIGAKTNLHGYLQSLTQ